MNEKTLIAVWCATLLTPHFFWVRGIVRSNAGDMAAGIVILIVIAFWVCLAGNHSGSHLFGGILFLFGIVTLIAGSFAKPDCPIPQMIRIFIAILFIFPTINSCFFIH